MTALLHQLSIDSFRGIRGMAFDDVTRITIVVGENNSGKSSVLEAAGVLLRPADAVHWQQIATLRDVDENVVDGLWTVFPDTGRLDPNYGFRLTGPVAIGGMLARVLRAVTATFSATEAPGSDGTPLLWGRVLVKVNDDPAIAMRFPAAVQVPLELNFEHHRVFTASPALHYSSKALVEHLSRVVDEGNKRLAVELLQLFDAEITDIDVSASFGRFAAVITHQSRGVVELSSFGDGVRRTVALALLLTRASGGVLLIDELEAGIHRRMLKSVLRSLLLAAKEADVQIISTTHSLETVDATMACVQESGLIDELSVFWMKREAGRHRVKRYGFDRLHLLREQGFDVR